MSDADAVAVIGAAVRLPGAQTLAEFWTLLRSGRSEVRAVGDDSPRSLRAADRYVPVHGMLEGERTFDFALFGFNRREASLLDPQQRKLLECSFEVLDGAGLSAGASPVVGVVAGTGVNLYAPRNVAPDADSGDIESTSSLLVSEKDHAATRIAHRLDLRGPAVTVQTSCSTSLVALHVARQSLLCGDADVMLAGGASVQVPQRRGYVHLPGGITSPDGVCRAFDAAAAGAVPGSGVVVVALRRLHDAISAGDRILGVIRGSAINNDGSRKSGYTSPSVAGQVDVLERALRAAGCEASAVGYVETHGTGTPLGDAIELEALQTVFGRASRLAPAVVGTTKPNIGHTDSAAGLAGLVKAMLVLENRWFPPSINVTAPIGTLGETGSSLRIVTSGEEWRSDLPRFAGVSSFGLGGTNAHVVLAEAPTRAPAAVHEPRRTRIALSAPDDERLVAYRQRVAEALDRISAGELGDFAASLSTGRRQHQVRAVVFAAGVPEARAGVLAAEQFAAKRRPRLAFGFSGYSVAGDESWSRLVARCPSTSLHREVPTSLGSWTLAEHASRPVASGHADVRAGQVRMFARQMLVGTRLRERGLVPRAVIGHSLGEYAAAVHAGALTLGDAALLVSARAAVLAQCSRGRMIALRTSEDEAQRYLRDGVLLAAVNGPRSVVLSGERRSIEALETRAAADGISSTQLALPFAAHSSLLDGLLAPMEEAVATIVSRPLQVALVSACEERVYEPGESLPDDYWVRQLRAPVRFWQAAALLADRCDAFVEVGVGAALCAAAKARAPSILTVPVLPSGAAPQEAGERLSEVVGSLWQVGAVQTATDDVRSPVRRMAIPPLPLSDDVVWIEAPDAPPAPAEPPRAVAEQFEQGAPTPDAPAPERRRRRDPTPAAASTAPEAPQLAQLWSRSLGESRSYTDGDNFYALGGDSLALLELVSAIGTTFAVDLDPADFLKAPTFVGMLAAIDRVRGPSPRL